MSQGINYHERVIDALTIEPFITQFRVCKCCFELAGSGNIAGKHFDQNLVKLFLGNIDDFMVIRNKYTQKEYLVTPEDFKLSERDRI